VENHPTFRPPNRLPYTSRLPSRLPCTYQTAYQVAYPAPRTAYPAPLPPHTKSPTLHLPADLPCTPNSLPCTSPNAYQPTYPAPPATYQVAIPPPPERPTLHPSAHLPSRRLAASQLAYPAPPSHSSKTGRRGALARPSPSHGQVPRSPKPPTLHRGPGGDEAADSATPPSPHRVAQHTTPPSSPVRLAERNRWRALAGKSRRRRAYPQQIVTTRLLYCLQDPFAQLSRLQRI
jgi:hypothetical protein